MKKLLILSGKGGTGKTTAASAFIAFSKARMFADCDVDAPNLHIVECFDTGPERSDYYGSKKAFIDPEKCIGCGRCMEVCRFDAIKKTVSPSGSRCFVDEYGCEGCAICEYICPEKAVSLKDDIAGYLELYKDERLFSTAQLKMGRGNSGKLVSAVKSALDKAACERNAGETDLAVIDGSPGIGCPVIASIGGTDLVLIVAEPSVSGMSDMERIIRTAETFDVKFAVCVNKYDVSPENTEKIESFCRENNIPFAGRIPYDKAVSRAINSGKSIAETDSPSSRALFDVFSNVMRLLK